MAGGSGVRRPKNKKQAPASIVASLPAYCGTAPGSSDINGPSTEGNALLANPANQDGSRSSDIAPKNKLRSRNRENDEEALEDGAAPSGILASDSTSQEPQTSMTLRSSTMRARNANASSNDLSSVNEQQNGSGSTSGGGTTNGSNNVASRSAAAVESAEVSEMAAGAMPTNYHPAVFDFSILPSPCPLQASGQANGETSENATATSVERAEVTGAVTGTSSVDQANAESSDDEEAQAVVDEARRPLKDLCHKIDGTPTAKSNRNLRSSSYEPGAKYGLRRRNPITKRPNSAPMAGVIASERQAEEQDSRASSSATRTLVNGAQHVADVINAAINGPLRVSVGEPAEEVAALHDDQAMDQGDSTDIDGGNQPDIAVPPLIRPVAVRATGVTFPSFATTLQPSNVGLPALPVQDVQSPFNPLNAALPPAFGGLCHFPVAIQRFDLAGQGSSSQAFPSVQRPPLGRQVQFPGVTPNPQSSLSTSSTSVIDGTMAGQSRGGRSIPDVSLNNSQVVADRLAQEAVVRQLAFWAAATVQAPTSTSNGQNHVHPQPQQQQQLHEKTFISLTSTNNANTHRQASGTASAAHGTAFTQQSMATAPFSNFSNSQVIPGSMDYGGRDTPINSDDVELLPRHLLNNVFNAHSRRD
ncbi:hypothetical protein HDU76_004113 [Blyttiomyces sp. JEL0837]|nr:hypothetical protein HDU76_004113 [Blyttiomyces sp. JEL0837]